MGRSSTALRSLVGGAAAAMSAVLAAPVANADPGLPQGTNGDPAVRSEAVAPAAGLPVAPAGVAADTAPPGEGDVEDAKDAADAARAEVDEVTGLLADAEEHLEALQTDVAQAVTAQELAAEEAARAEAAARAAAAALASARADREEADRALAGYAALMYMQGGDLQNLTAMLLTPPNAMSDVSFVLDKEAREYRDHLAEARSAAARAADREARLAEAQAASAAALEVAEEARAALDREAEQAGAKAAELGTRLEELTARLGELQQHADDLAARRADAVQREEAARSSDVPVLGMQTGGAPGTGPRAAQELARPMVAARGWGAGDFDCLVTLWHNESGWSWSATNPSSGAYGIPQSLPGWKMASAGSDWLTNPATQIRWGLGYIEGRYGSPCAALSAFYSRSPHWY